MSNDSYIVPGLHNGIILLMIIAESKKPTSLAQLVKRSGIAKTSVFRILHTLENLDLISRDVSANTFTLSLGVLKLGFWKLSKMELTEIGQSILDGLRDDTGYSAHIVVRNGEQAVYIARAASKNKVVASGIGPGTHLPICRTGVGRMLISDMSLDEFNTLYPTEVIKSEHYPDTEKSTLWQLITQDRQNGFVISESFFEKGICSVVYPIKQNNTVAAVVTLTIPAQSIPLDEIDNLKAKVKKASEIITERLAYHK